VGLEDLISIGTIGLIKAVNTFNSGKNIKLATYASRCIENEILMYLRKISSQKTEVSFDEPLNTDWDGNELLLSDVLGTDDDEVCRPMEDDADRQMLMEAVSALDERERMIILMRFGLLGSVEYTQKEVADMLGISQSYISRLEKRIIVRLRREMTRQMQY
jgi:RNA polymerase sporulation-specific sigma factor